MYNYLLFMNIFDASYLYAVIIFLGYYNKSCFYECFGIVISSYLTPGELLLAFLPITSIFLLIIGVILILLMVNFIKFYYQQSKIIQQNKTQVLLNEFLNISLMGSCFKLIAKHYFKGEWKSFHDIIHVIKNLMLFLYGTALFIFFIGYVFHVLKIILSIKTEIYISTFGLFLMGIFWFILFENVVKKEFENLRPFKNFFRISFVVLFLMGILNLANMEAAKRILNGKSKVYIDFEYEGKTFTTSDNFVFVGQTEKYFFMRQLSTNENYIFPREKILKTIQIYAIPK